MLNTHTLNTQALNARRAAAVDLSRLHGVMRMSGALWPTVWGALSGEMAMHGGGFFSLSFSRRCWAAWQ